MVPGRDDGRDYAPLTRRRFLQVAGAAGASIAAGGLLAACTDLTGATSTSLAAATSTSGQATGGPVRGGRLRVGLVGAGPSETLDPNRGVSYDDDSKNFVTFESLTKRRPDGSGVDLALAEELEPNSDGTLWTVRLRDDVVFHNGKDLTADDVIYSYQYILDPANESLGRPLISNFIDPAQLRRIDDRTLEIGLLIPYFFLPATLTEQRVRVFPEGTTSFDSPIGTGPFKFESWTPGEQALYVRNDDYRVHDGPFVDELEYVAIGEAQSRLSALQAGQVDAIIFLDIAQFDEVESEPELQTLTGPSMGNPRFAMDVTQPPFDDVRVRQAFRHLIDRQEILDTVFQGHGRIGNDLEALGDPNYASEIEQRTYDPERARDLLQQAGAEELQAELNVGEIADGIVGMATLYQEQASAGGVTLDIRNWPPDQYWSTPYMNRPLFATAWAGRPLVPQFFMATFGTAPFNETSWQRPDFDELVLEAISSPDEALRSEILVDVQRLLYDEGGFIIPVFPDFVDAMSARVKGVTPSVFWPLGNFDWLDTYLED